MVLRRFYGCRTCGGPHYSDECDHNRGRYFGYEDQQNRWSRHEEEDVSLKDMMKNFIDVQNARNDEWETSIKELNDKVEQDFINDQGSLQDLERKFERMSERFANQPTGQMQISTHPNPRPNNQNNNGGQSSQGPRYQTPHHRDEQVNAIFTRSGFRYGDEEERNENEKKSELGTSAPQSSPMRRTGGSDGFILSDHSLGATQSSPMRRSEHPDPENDQEVVIEVEDQVGDEPMVQNEDGAPKTTTIPPTKAYKPRIPYPQQLRKEKMKAQYGKFLDLIKSVHVNVPLVDVIAGMPNYGKFIKELVSEKGKSMEEQAAYLNAECSAIVKNEKLPPKLNDPGSFLLTCTFSKTYHCNALADLGASINLMPYSLYAKLALGVLKPTKMSIKLADQSFQYPLGIVENMLVQVGRFVFPVDFVILEMEEDSKVPLILGRPFLNTADAIIRVKKKEISLGVGDDRETFSYYKSKKHSYSTDETCFKIDVIDNDMCDLELQDFLDDEELDEEQEEKSLDLELEELLGKDMVSVDSTINGDITLEEFERMFDLSTEPVVTKKENEDGGEKKLEPETEVEKETVEASDGEPSEKLEVKKESNQKSKGISKKPVYLLYFLTCLEKDKVLQGKDDNNKEPLNFDDFTYGKPIMNGAEKDKNGGEDGDLRQWKDGSIMRETKEWHDAWAKTRYELIVSNYEILFDDLICRYIGGCNVLKSWHLEGNRGKASI